MCNKKFERVCEKVVNGIRQCFVTLQLEDLNILHIAVSSHGLNSVRRACTYPCEPTCYPDHATAHISLTLFIGVLVGGHVNRRATCLRYNIRDWYKKGGTFTCRIHVRPVFPEHNFELRAGYRHENNIMKCLKSTYYGSQTTEMSALVRFSQRTPKSVSRSVVQPSTACICEIISCSLPTNLVPPRLI